ncbi:MAG: HDOD domain-containing protein [Burkholderiales bacterium]
MSTTQQQLDEITASGKLPSPKGVALKLMRSAQREDASLTEVAKLIQADPALLGRVLKLANAPVWGLQGPVTSASDALSVLGVTVVKQFAVSMSILSNYRSGACAGFDYDLFWSHSLATAASLKLLCRHTGTLTPEERFSCGLLSRVGSLALATTFPEEFGELLSLNTDFFGPDIMEREQARFGLDHNELTVALLNDWGLPQTFVDAIGGLKPHSPAETADDPGKLSVALLLYLAEYWAVLCPLDKTFQDAMLPELLAAGADIQLDVCALADMHQQVLTEWREWLEILKVPGTTDDRPAGVRPASRMAKQTDHSQQAAHG